MVTNFKGITLKYTVIKICHSMKGIIKQYRKHSFMLHFVLKNGVLFNQLNCGFHGLSTNVKDSGLTSTILKTKVALLTHLGERGRTVMILGFGSWF